MTWSRRLLAVALSLVLTAPMAIASGTHAGTVHTGESDVYHADEHQVDPRDPDLVEVCPDDIFWVRLVLTLENPQPGTAVALTVPDGFAQSAPVDVATTDDPTADVYVQLGGCNREATAVVTGLAAPGGADYTLETQDADSLSLERSIQDLFTIDANPDPGA